MRTILTNGKIYIKKNVFQEAMLIENGAISKVSSNKEILKEDYDQSFDLQGKTVLPGMNDSHLHLESVGQIMNSCDLSVAQSIEDIIKIGRDFIEKNPDIEVLSGRGWNQDYFLNGEKRLLNRFDLDRISTDIPIVFKRVCGHVASSNSKALELLNIDKNIKINGGTIELDANGHPNGVFNENAVAFVNSIVPERSNKEIVDNFLKGQDYALSVGITSVQSCDVRSKDSQNIFNILHDLNKDRKWKLRYSHQFSFQDIDDFKSYLETEHKSDKYDEKFLSKGALKLFKDGSLGARTALMLNDYKDAPGNKGVAALSDDDFQEICSLAAANGIRVLTHAIGDGAIENVINTYENIMTDGKNPLRHAIVHCQITNKEQLKRIRDLNIPVMLQPIFLDYDRMIVESRVGKDLASTSYAFNSLNKSGVNISFGTDAPVEVSNPFPNIYCAVTRLGLDEKPVGGFYPDEKMDLSDAIDAYTIGSAYNEFKEDFKGRLKTGYVADLIVLDKDIFSIDENKIKDIQVEKTMIDGKFVYIKE